MTIDEISAILSLHPENFPQALAQYLGEGRDINARASNGWPLIVRAAELTNIEAIKLLLENSADINNTIKVPVGHHPGHDGYSALHVLTSNNDARTLELVDFLLEHDIDVNIKAKDGDTPLHFATWSGNYNFIEKLRKKHADINMRNRYGNTAIVDAASKGFDEVVSLLTKAGAGIEEFLKYPDQMRTTATRRPHVEQMIKAYRPKMYKIFKEYNRAIPTPSSPYDPITAQEVELHNAEIEARRVAYETLDKIGINKDVNKIIFGYLYEGPVPQLAHNRAQAKVPPPSQLASLESEKSVPEPTVPESTALQEAPIGSFFDKASESVLTKLKAYIAKLKYPHEGTYGRSDQPKKIKVAEDIQRMFSHPLKPEDFFNNIKHIYFQIQKNRTYTGSYILHGYGQLDKILKEAKEVILNSVRQEPYGHSIAELADYIQNAKINGVEKRSTLLNLRTDQVKKLAAARQVFELIKPGTHTDIARLEKELKEAIKLNTQATVKTPLRGSGKLDKIFQDLLKEVKRTANISNPTPPKAK